MFKAQIFFLKYVLPLPSKKRKKPLAYFCCSMYCNKSNKCLKTPLLHATKEEKLAMKL